MEALTALIVRLAGEGTMSETSVHALSSVLLATLMFIIMALCAIIFTSARSPGSCRAATVP